MAQAKKLTTAEERSIEDSLRTLYELQQVDTKIAQIVKLRGELPLEVQDLEDEIEGLRTRIAKLEEEVSANNATANRKKHEIKAAELLMKKYMEQQKNVRNNREYDSLNKEIAYQQLEVELRNKQIKECKQKNEGVSQNIEDTRAIMTEREHDLEAKRSELEEIIAETSKEEAELKKQSEALQEFLPERLLRAYTRICQNVRNGMGVVSIVRDSCGGCFNRIPPQRQLDIRSHKRVIVCEYCGRIIVDDPTLDEVESDEK